MFDSPLSLWVWATGLGASLFVLAMLALWDGGARGIRASHRRRRRKWDRSARPATEQERRMWEAREALRRPSPWEEESPLVWEEEERSGAGKASGRGKGN